MTRPTELPILYRVTMIYRALLLLLLLGTVVPALGETPHAASSALEAGHADGAPCPDSEGNGDPCGPACPCACCPGHRVPALASAHAHAIPSTPGALEALPLDALNPQDVVRRVFHPPRA